MKTPDTFRRILFKELDDETSRGYSFWQSIPSSFTRRSLVLLDGPQPELAANRTLHRAAIEDIIAVNMANERRESARLGDSLLTWLEKARQPWRFAESLGEWNLKGYRERQELARELTKMRKNIDNLTSAAKTITSYYIGVTEKELELALNWKPIRGRLFFDRMQGLAGNLRIERVRQLTSERRFRFSALGCELELEASIRGGVLSYGIFGFFDNPGASSS